MEIVGHSPIEMTMNVYGHTNLETQRRALISTMRSCSSSLQSNGEEDLLQVSYLVRHQGLEPRTR